MLLHWYMYSRGSPQLQLHVHCELQVSILVIFLPYPSHEWALLLLGAPAGWAIIFKSPYQIAAEWPNLLVEAVSLLFLQEDYFGHILNDLDFKLRP